MWQCIDLISGYYSALTLYQEMEKVKKINNHGGHPVCVHPGIIKHIC